MESSRSVSCRTFSLFHDLDQFNTSSIIHVPFLRKAHHLASAFRDPWGHLDTAWNASLSNHGVHLFTPAAFTFATFETRWPDPKNTSAFREDADLMFSFLTNQFLIYANAGNVTFPGYNGTDDEPWEFVAVEALFHLCVNRYETTFESGSSRTTAVGSSYKPADIANNKPAFNTECKDNGVERGIYCWPVEGGANFVYLRDTTDSTHDNNSIFVMNRLNTFGIAWPVAQRSSVRMWYDGKYDGIRLLGPGLEIRALEKILYVGDDKLKKPADQINPFNRERQLEELGIFYETYATSFTNAQVPPISPSPHSFLLPYSHSPIITFALHTYSNYTLTGQQDTNDERFAVLERNRLGRTSLCHGQLGLGVLPRCPDRLFLHLPRGDHVSNTATADPRAEELRSRDSFGPHA